MKFTHQIFFVRFCLYLYTVKAQENILMKDYDPVSHYIYSKDQNSQKLNFRS